MIELITSLLLLGVIGSWCVLHEPGGPLGKVVTDVK
jgi:hypothetical protein